MPKYILVTSVSTGEVVGTQFTPANEIPVAPTGKEHHDVDLSTYSTINSGLRHEQGGGNRWMWNGSSFVETTDPRKEVRVTTDSQVIQGTPLSVTFDVMNGDVVDTAFSGPIFIRARTGDRAKLFRMNVVNGTKTVNIPTASVDESISFSGSEKTRIRGGRVSVEVAQDL